MTKQTAVKLVSIDKHNLEQEWIDQPGAIHYILIQYAEALAARKVAESELEKVMAEEGEEIRRQLESAKKKETETGIKRLLIAGEPYQVALQARDAAAHALHLIEAERAGLEHKKTALENLTKLRIADWYSEPKRPREPVNHDEDSDEQRAASAPKSKTRPSRVT